MLDWNTTLAILLVGAAFGGFANWKARQDYPPGALPLIPWNGVMFVALIVVFVMAAHLITLYTGKPFSGRMG
jgi:hypothetical protein